MRHPPPYPHHPPKPPACEGVLLPKILAREHCRLPRVCAELCLEGLSPRASAPLRVTGVQAGQEPPRYSRVWDACGQCRLRVSIPVCVWLCDSCGASYTAASCVEVETAFPPRLEGPGFLFVLPYVQLLCAQEAGPGCRFPVQLCVTLEAYLLRFEPCYPRPQKPACPPLPLYPPPIDPGCPPCSCGW